MIKNSLIALILVGTTFFAFSQNVGIGTNTPNSSAKLEISSTNSGLLVPRVSLSSTTDVATIATPATSLLVYNTNATITGGDGAGYYYYDGAQWVKIITSSSSVGGEFQSIGGVVQNTTDLLNDDFVFGSPTMEYTSPYYRKMLFDHSKGAFRAGYCTTTNWNEASLGNNSAAFGSNTIASNTNSFAAGNYCQATGGSSVAFGSSNLSSGVNAASFGYLNSATGAQAFAAGNNNWATGNQSVALGSTNQTPGYYSFAAGNNNHANGRFTVTIGYNCTADTNNAIAIGSYTQAKAYYSLATGYQNYARSWSEAVFGAYATDYTALNGVGFNSSDRLFAVGNGTSTVNRSDAFYIRKNGYSGFSTSAPTATLSVNGGANKPGGGSWAVFSDANLKKNVSDYNEGLELIKQIHTVNFQYNETMEKFWPVQDPALEGKVYQGVIAQELQQIAPDMVREVEVYYADQEGKMHTENYLEVDPSKFTYTLINATQEQQVIIEQQSKQLTEQEARIAELERLVKQLLEKE